MSRQRQLSFFPAPRIQHGGDLRAGKRKLARPLDPARPLHVVLKSTRARGMWSFQHHRHRARVRRQVYETAARFRLRVLGYANVGNHLHLLLKSPDRAGVQNFLRLVTGRIALGITGAAKGRGRGPFWERLAFSRVVSWGRDLRRMLDYLTINQLEGDGNIPRQAIDEVLALARKNGARSPPVLKSR